jgi:hypothetical protein
MVWAYPVTNWVEISFLEDALFHEFHEGPH